MQAEQGLSAVLCEFYEARILCGYYRIGDRLPSIAQIGVTFHVAPSTARAALSVLEQKGYIAVDARKAARVIYQAGPGEYKRNSLNMLAPRWQEILQLEQAGSLILKPCWQAGFKAWTQGQWQTFQQEMITPPFGLSSLWIHCFLTGLGKLDNQLIINLYWEIINFFRFPHLVGKPPQQSEWPTRSKEAFFDQVLVCDYRRVLEEMTALMQEAEAQGRLDAIEPIVFKWRIRRQRPQMRYSLASTIVRGIMDGGYPIGSALPPLSQMAEQYGVSLNTVRRAVDLLNALGVIESRQGKKSVVCMKSVRIDVRRPEIREGLRLYREALEFLELTIGQVTRYTLGAAAPEQRRELAQNIALLRREGREYGCYEICFGFIIAYCPLSMVRECYAEILQLITWGYPLALSRLNGADLRREYALFLAQIAATLQEDDFDGYAAAWHALMQREVQSCAFLREE